VSKKSLFYLAAAFVCSAPLHAQTVAESGDPELDAGEIIVTAQKRSQRLSQVPIAISAYDSVALERIGATELERVAQVTPGLSIQLQDRLLPGISVRGITSDDTSPASEPRVALFQDGVPITQIASGYAEMFDVNRIEVERGPQSTLHGRSALNGGISVYQQMPKPDFGMEIKAGAGDMGFLLGQTVINLPVTESFGIRLGALRRKRDGALRDADGDGTYNRVNSGAYRLTSRFEPSPDFRFSFSGTYDVDDTDSGGAFKSNVFIPRDQVSGTVIGDLDFWSPTHLSTLPGMASAYSHREIVGLSGTTEVGLGGPLGLTSITGYRWYKACQAGDIDGSTTDIIAYDLCNGGEQFSEELRLNIGRTGIFEGFVGLGYFNARNYQTTDLGTDERAAALLFSGALRRAAPQGLTNAEIMRALGASAASYKALHLDRRRTVAEIETFDIFADGTLHLTDQLEAFAGGRVTWDRKEIAQQVTTPLGVSKLTGGGLLMTMTTGGAEVRGKHSSSVITGRAGLRYQFTPNANVYAVYGLGKRPEVLDLTPTGTANILPSERLSSIEVGTKLRLFNNRVTADLAVYNFKYSDFQTLQRNQDRLVPVNAGKANATGFEAQGSWTVSDNLNVYGSYAYNRARFTTGAYDGNRFRNAPDHKFALGFEANLPTAIGEVTLGSVYTWQSKIFFSDDNDRADLQVRSRAAFSDLAVDELQPAYGLLNARLGLKAADGRWQVNLIGENLTDKKFIVDAGNTGDSFGMPTFIVGSRRSVRVEFGVQF
jgi:outer membrane receptor protein involved in Fe transport